MALLEQAAKAQARVGPIPRETLRRLLKECQWHTVAESLGVVV